MEDSEIPPDIIQKSDEFEQLERSQAEGVPMVNDGGGRRKRKEVDYSHDLMSDEQFLKQIDDVGIFNGHSYSCLD